MRCSTCMSELQPRGNDFICPNCQTLMEGEALDIPPGFVEPDLPTGPGLALRLVRVLSVAIGIVAIFALGSATGWYLRSEVSSLDELSPKFLADMVTGQTEPERDESALDVAGNSVIDAERVVPLGGDRSEGVGLIAVGGKEAAYRRIELSEDGVIRFQETLTGLPEGQLVAASRHTGQRLILAFRTGNALTIFARNADGTEAWSRQIDLADTENPHVALDQLGNASFLVASAGDPATPTAHLFSATGEIEWTRRLTELRDGPVRLAASPFDEIVLMGSSSSGAGRYALLSYTASGIPGLSTSFSADNEDAILDMSVDRLGRILVLLSGAPPDLVVADALGRNVERAPLAPLITLAADSACTLLSSAGRLHVFCGSEDGFTETVFDTSQEPPSLLARTGLDVDQPALTLGTEKAVAAIVPAAEGSGFEIVSLARSRDPDLAPAEPSP